MAHIHIHININRVARANFMGRINIRPILSQKVDVTGMPVNFIKKLFGPIMIRQATDKPIQESVMIYQVIYISSHTGTKMHLKTGYTRLG